METAR
jgi:adenylate kinase